jgi:hypothetical protein
MTLSQSAVSDLLDAFREESTRVSPRARSKPDAKRHGLVEALMCQPGGSRPGTTGRRGDI